MPVAFCKAIFRCSCAANREVAGSRNVTESLHDKLADGRSEVRSLVTGPSVAGAWINVRCPLSRTQAVSKNHKRRQNSWGQTC